MTLHADGLVASRRSNWRAFSARISGDDDLRPPAEIAEACFDALPAILRGEALMTDTSFPEGSLRRMEPVYKDNATARFFNMALAETVVALIEARRAAQPDARLRILEIGAGTGGTTSVVLPCIEPFGNAIETYCYTDLSRSFLLDAEKRYGGRRLRLAYQRADIERPLADQGFEPGSFDIVIAANVLHATRSLRVALRNAKSALAQNGVLLLNEMTDKTDFATLIFGLIDGWSLAQDPACVFPEPGPDAAILAPPSRRGRFQGDDLSGVAGAESSDNRSSRRRAMASSVSERIRRRRRLPGRPRQPRAGAARGGDSVSVAPDRLKGEITACLSRTLRRAASELKSDAPFADYGLDSILGARSSSVSSASASASPSTRRSSSTTRMSSVWPIISFGPAAIASRRSPPTHCRSRRRAAARRRPRARSR